MRLNKSFFDIKNRLFRNFWFWFWLLLPIASALIVASLITIENNFNWYPSFTKEALENFINYQKTPMLIAGLIFPCVAIVVAHHRSALDIQQIEETKRQTVFANYLKHREEFFKFLDDLAENFNVRFKSRNELYNKLYPKNGMNFFKIESHADNEGEIYLESFILAYNKVVKDYIFQCDSQIIARDNAKDAFRVNTKILEEFYSDILSLCYRYLFLEPKETNETSIEWTGFQDDRRQGKGYIPTKPLDPLFFLRELSELVDKLLVFTQLETDELAILNNGASSVVLEQYKVLIEKRCNPETFPIR